MALRQLFCMRDVSLKIGKNYSNNGLFNKFNKNTIIRENTSKSIKTEPTLRSTPNPTPTPFDGVSITGKVTPNNLVKSFVFTVGFSAGAFVGTSIWEYECARSKAVKSLKTAEPFVWMKSQIRSNKKKAESWHRQIETWWNNLPTSEKVFIPICALNVLVFGLWRIPRLQPHMVKYFCASPIGRAICWPMFLSTFSHYSAFHIFANMFVLHSFTHGTVAALGKEQFLALYLSAGVFSSLASYFYKAVIGTAGLSLGASGAIMAVLAYVCTQYPETQLSIILLPMWTFSAGTAIKFIVGLDLAGVLMGWKFFDHAAHLGGAAFGIFWCYFGSQYIWPKREYVLRQWHEFRNSITK